LRSYLADECRVPIAVSRHYFLPEYVNDKSLVIVSSYSGNTEETNASYADAIKRKAKIFCITSGGAVKALARKKKHPFIEIPGGLPPRAALGLSFFPTLITLSKLGLIPSQKKAIKETLTLLKAKSSLYDDIASPQNLALRLAEQLKGKLPVVYSAADRFDAVSMRWRGQFSENAKVLAYGHVFPELNHNEIVGWQVLEDVMKKIHVLILRDREDHVRIQLRMDITRDIIAGLAGAAILNNVDPTPVSKIDFLKNELARAK
ncbi:MAG: bifunctional phosphoglucose/phosphomannose isomerase, partial [Ignavibacteriales bacterium]|nr:bifunctional phosphoglucose/phosphomannose isomerase [Ignavibacteriales bacterium]